MGSNAKNNAITAVKLNPRIICLTVDGTGTAKLSGPDADLVALTDNGTGDYTLTFATALQELPYVFAPMSLTADVDFKSHATIPTRTVVRILARTIETTPAAVDADFQVMMLVHTAEDIYFDEVD